MSQAKAIVSARKLAAILVPVLMKLAEINEASLKDEVANALLDFEREDAECRFVDQSLIEAVRAVYPCDRYEVPYTDDELVEFCYSAYTQGLAPDPSVGDCYPMRKTGGVSAVTSYYSLMQQRDEHLAQRKLTANPYKYRRVTDPEEREFLGLKNENDEAYECSLEIVDRNPRMEWVKRFDTLRAELGLTSVSGKNWTEAKEIIEKINVLLGPCPTDEVTTYSAIGKFFADEWDTDPVLKRFTKKTPKTRAQDRAINQVNRSILPFRGARRTTTAEMDQETLEVIQDREQSLRGLDKPGDEMKLGLETIAKSRTEADHAKNKMALRGAGSKPDDLI